MNIKDPEVHAAAQELARRRGVTMTEAVRQAVAEALEREERRVEDVVATMTEIARRAAAKPAPYLTDDDLYDERGLPR